jgi:hypothetical protein
MKRKLTKSDPVDDIIPIANLLARYALIKGVDGNPGRAMRVAIERWASQSPEHRKMVKNFENPDYIRKALKSQEIDTQAALKDFHKRFQIFPAEG